MRPDDSEAPVTCWCGEVLDDEALDAMAADLDETCGGTGELHCECGGDFCVCHNHGSQPCDGCEDCDDEDGSLDYGDEDDWADDDGGAP